MAKLNTVDFPSKFKKKKVYGTASASGATASTTLTKLASVLVPAGTFITTEILTVTSLITKTGTGVTCSVFLYHNDIDDLTTPTTLGFFRSNAAGAITFTMQRRLAIANATGAGNGTKIMQPTVNAINDSMPGGNGLGATAGGFLYQPINWGADSYIIIAGQVTTRVDTLRCISLQISN